MDIVEHSSETAKATRNQLAGNYDMIVVKARQVNGGFDIKFEDDPYNVRLHGIMTPNEYANVISKINAALEECRSGT